MKLSELVQYQNLLSTLSVDHAADVAVKKVAEITHFVQYHSIQIETVSADLINIQQSLRDNLQIYKHTLEVLGQEIKNLIESQESKYFADSTENYEQARLFETVDYILSRPPNIDPEHQTVLHNRLLTYANWKYPGMIIRPARNPWIQDLVALDPLYLVDTDSKLFAPVTGLFTPEYQRRLRYYVVKDHTAEDIFWNLPRAQFAFIGALNYLEFRPWEVVKKYIDETYMLLRPGGSFLFSFNDCDRWTAVGLVEHHFGSYIPGRLLRDHAIKSGFEITFESHQSNITWIELRRPGLLTSIKGGQTLASIFTKNVDIPLKELYNALTLEQLVEIADLLKVDISEAKTKREFNIKKVRKTVWAHLQTQDYPEATLRKLFKPKENT